MGKRQPLYKVVVGRSREVRGPDAMEMAFAIVIITVVMFMAMHFGRTFVAMAQTIDAVSLVSAPVHDEIVYHAVHGRWPAPGDPVIIGSSRGGSSANHLALGEGGVITAQLATRTRAVFGPASTADAIHGALSFRPQLLGSHDAPTLVFLCGHAPPVAGQAAPTGTNRTTLPEQVLPPFCR